MRSTCRSPAILMPPILQHHCGASIGRPQTGAPCLPAHPAWTRLSTSCCCDQEHPAHVGSPGLLPAQRVDANSMLRARGTRQARDLALFTPAWGRRPQGCLRFCTPKASSACAAVSVCVQTSGSVDYPRNMHFGTRLVTSYTSSSLRPCFHPIDDPPIGCQE